MSPALFPSPLADTLYQLLPVSTNYSSCSLSGIAEKAWRATGWVVNTSSLVAGHNLLRLVLLKPSRPCEGPASLQSPRVGDDGPARAGANPEPGRAAPHPRRESAEAGQRRR